MVWGFLSCATTVLGNAVCIVPSPGRACLQSVLDMKGRHPRGDDVWWNLARDGGTLRPIACMWVARVDPLMGAKKENAKRTECLELAVRYASKSLKALKRRDSCYTKEGPRPGWRPSWSSPRVSRFSASAEGRESPGGASGRGRAIVRTRRSALACEGRGCPREQIAHSW